MNLNIAILPSGLKTFAHFESDQTLKDAIENYLKTLPRSSLKQVFRAPDNFLIKVTFFPQTTENKRMSYSSRISLGNFKIIIFEKTSDNSYTKFYYELEEDLYICKKNIDAVCSYRIPESILEYFNNTLNIKEVSKEVFGNIVYEFVKNTSVKTDDVQYRLFLDLLDNLDFTFLSDLTHFSDLIPTIIHLGLLDRFPSEIRETFLF